MVLLALVNWNSFVHTKILVVTSFENQFADDIIITFHAHVS